MHRLIELITGQNNLNYVQSKNNPGYISELCRYCEEEEETFAHPYTNTNKEKIGSFFPALWLMK